MQPNRGAQPPPAEKAPPGWLRALDLVAVTLFVVIGLSVHGHSLGAGSVISTLWPFAAALAVAWLAVGFWARDVLSLPSGATAAVVTDAVATVLRVVSGQGTAAAFIAVTLVFLGATFLAWRLLAGLVWRRPRVRSRT